MSLGDGGEIVYKGKASIPGVKALKHSEYTDYWPVDNDNHYETTQ
jgi:hypothetical protein